MYTTTLQGSERGMEGGREGEREREREREREERGRWRQREGEGERMYVHRVRGLLCITFHLEEGRADY